MSDEAKNYNGWSNYETWCVNLWLTNEQTSYQYWREHARKHRKDARTCANVREGVWSVELAEKTNLARQLREEIEEASPLSEPSMFSDLLNAALGEVDWHELAAAFLEDLDPEPDEGEEEPDQDDEEAYSAEEFERVKRERIENQKEPLFELGQVVSTPGALAVLSRETIAAALARHHRGDWGEVRRHDWRANEEALTQGFRLFSVYSEKSEKFWVITEADRSSTCVLLPSEY